MTINQADQADAVMGLLLEEWVVATPAAIKLSPVIRLLFAIRLLFNWLQLVSVKSINAN